MQSSETYLSACDGVQLFFRLWLPETQAVSCVCLVHGLGEHTERYSHLADFMNSRAIAVLGFDLRGHGRSQGKRGHAPSLDALMDDIQLLIERSTRLFPGLPCFLYGHSLGGLLVLNYVLRKPANLAGVITSGAGLRTALEKQSLKVSLVRLFGALLPNLSLPSGLDVNGLSRDPQVVQAYRLDPLVHNRATLGLAAELIQAIKFAFDHAVEFSLPLLMMHGEADAVAFPAGSSEFAQRVHGECTLKTWPGLYHEIHNEPEKAQVLSYMAAWILSKILPLRTFQVDRES